MDLAVCSFFLSVIEVHCVLGLPKLYYYNYYYNYRVRNEFATYDFLSAFLYSNGPLTLPAPNFKQHYRLLFYFNNYRSERHLNVELKD